MQFTRNILKVYRQATGSQYGEGIEWYPKAHDLAMDIANGDIWKGAGVIAAFSPLTPWWRNKELAADSLRTGVARTDTLGNSSRAAQRIIDGEHTLDVLKGIKVRSFAENIVSKGVSDICTVDVHAYSIAVGRPVPSSVMKMNKTQYREIAECYARAAKREGLYVPQIQAVTWVTWRDKHVKANVIRALQDRQKANALRIA